MANHMDGYILVPVDFSDNSREALLYAARLAMLCSTKLMILHVVHDPGEAPGFYAKRRKTRSLRKMEDLAADALEQFILGLKENEHYKILKNSKRLLISGLPASRILEIAHDDEVAQVVMGCRGRTGLSSLIMGSKAEQVVRLCQKPVTVVKEPPVQPKKPKKKES